MLRLTLLVICGGYENGIFPQFQKALFGEKCLLSVSTNSVYGASGNYFDIFDDYVALSTYWTTTWPC